MKQYLGMVDRSGERRPEEATTRHIPALDGIRGVAIASVLAYHLLDANNLPRAGLVIRLLAQLREAGWIGVDLFFVLSGFLITGILYNTRSGQHYFRNFYARRALRIFPLYYGVLLVMAVAVLLAGCHLLSGYWILATYTSSLIGANYSDCRWLNLNHFWTLSVEELFYCIWPAVVYMAKTPRRILWAAVAGSLFSICLRACFVFGGAFSRDVFIVYSFGPARLDSLLIGAMLAISLRTRARQHVLRFAPFVLATGLIALILLLWHNPMLSWAAGPFWSIGLYDLLAITFAALIASALQPGWIERAMALRGLRFLGRYSYGMYVFHYILVGLLDLRLRAALRAWTGSLLWSIVATGVILFAITLALSIVSFHAYEKHWLLLKRRFAAPASSPALRHVAS